MSFSKPPSFTAVDEKKGTLTIAFLTNWYDVDRCGECPRFQKLVVVASLSRRKDVAYCECMEAEEPCELTGIRYESGVKKDGIET